MRFKQNRSSTAEDLNVLMVSKEFFSQLEHVVGARFVQNIRDSETKFLNLTRFKLSRKAHRAMQQKVFKPHLLNNITKINFP